MFEPNQNPPHVIPESGLLPETTNEFQPNPYANVYAVNQPYFTPHITHQYLTPHITQPYIPQQILLTEQTAGNKTHKWWSFHNLKKNLNHFFINIKTNILMKHKIRPIYSIINHSCNKVK